MKMDSKKIVWNLFKKTGDVKYYLMSKKLEGEEDATDKEDRGNSNRGH